MNPFEQQLPSLGEDVNGILWRRKEALEIARKYSQIDGAHHKSWVIDQMCRSLLGDKYEIFIADYKAGEDGPLTYEWSEGIAP